jgi:hypothetical protein
VHREAPGAVRPNKKASPDERLKINAQPKIVTQPQLQHPLRLHKSPIP